MKFKLLPVALVFLLFAFVVPVNAAPSYPVTYDAQREGMRIQGVHSLDLGYGWMEAYSKNQDFQMKVLIQNHKVAFLSFLAEDGSLTKRFLYVNGNVAEDLLTPGQRLLLVDKLLHFWPEGYPASPTEDPLAILAVYLAEHWKL